MATGDQSAFEDRLRRLLPRGWFGDDGSHPITDAMVTAGATAWAWCYSLYTFAVMQTRIRTSSGGWLDLAAYDFFGDNIRRSSGQSDASFLNTFKIEASLHPLPQRTVMWSPWSIQQSVNMSPR